MRRGDGGQEEATPLQAARDRLQVVLDAGVEVDRVPRGRTDDDLVHVAVGRVEETAPIGGGEHRDRPGRARGAEVRPFERVDGDVDLDVVGLTAADPLADVEHRGLVALALPDHDRSPHGEAVHRPAHRLHGDVVRVTALALAHRPRRLDRRLLRDVQEVARQALDVDGGSHFAFPA